MIRDLCVSGFFLLTMNCAEDVRRDCLVIGDYNIHHLNIPGVCISPLLNFCSNAFRILRSNLSHQNGLFHIAVSLMITPQIFPVGMYAK